MSIRCSVALATLNGLPYLPAQVESILPQLGPADELVISDNGSTDGTLAYLDSLSQSDARVRVVHCGQRGLLYNFSCALNACTGDIVLLSDQDDVWLPGKLSAVQAAFTPGVSAVLHGCTWVDESLQPLKNQPKPLPEAISRWRILWRNPVQGCCLALRREVLTPALPLPRDIPMHDSYLGLMALKSGKIAVLPESLLLYRRHGDSAGQATARQAPVQMLRDRLQLVRATR